MSAVNSLADEVGVEAACRALRMPRSALYRDRASRRVCPLPAAVAAPRRRPPLALSEHFRTWRWLRPSSASALNRIGQVDSIRGFFVLATCYACRKTDFGQ